MSETTHNPSSEELTASPLRGLIAASVDSGLAGLLSSVLAQHRDGETEAEDHSDVTAESLFEDEVAEVTPRDEAPREVAPPQVAPPQVAPPEQDLIEESLFVETPEAGAQTPVSPAVAMSAEVGEEQSTPLARRGGRLGPRLADAVAPNEQTGLPTAQVAAEAKAIDKTQFDSNPVYAPDVPFASMTPPAPAAPSAPEVRRQATRILSTLQIGLLLEGLSQLRARPGEDGLPPGMLLMDVKGPLGRYNNDSLYTIRAQIDAAVRAGDMALVTPDIGIVLFCGGLFFPGDLEVMGARLRRRALDANPAVSSLDELQVIVAGALSIPGEDPAAFIHRGVAAFDYSIDSARQDIVISYADDKTS
jgi:hypothetical protein